MKSLLLTLTLSVLLALELASCGRSAETYWKDGPFRVYAMDDDFSATRLGFDNRPGILVLVSEDVVAVGSNDKWIVAQQFVKPNGIYFYVMPKAHEDFYLGKVEGPMTPEQFSKEAAKRELPTFSWRKAGGNVAD